MTDPPVVAPSQRIAEDVAFGPDVRIEADEVEIGAGARIGFSDDDDFRTEPGVRIRVKRLILGRGVQIGRAVRIDGGEIRLDEGVRVRRHSSIHVTQRLQVGAFGTIAERCEISGREVRIGQELWMLPGAKIGGGSAFERSSRLEAGHYLHLGLDTIINTARPVRIGHEVGLGTRTSLYTHGAYSSALDGFPVAFDGIEIGDFSWLPGAVVNPGVQIGRCCVIGVNSLVTSSIPDGCLAAGSPARVLRESAYPRRLAGDDLLDFFADFLAQYATLLGSDAASSREADAIRLDADSARYVFAAGASGASSLTKAGRCLIMADGASSIRADDGLTLLDTASRHISGMADSLSSRLTNELRRHGIRFYSRPRDGRYVDWEPNPPRF